MFLDERQLTSALRDDIREERAREHGVSSAGGDFYGPFWADAKAHVFGRSDLTDTTAERIAVNNRRRNLYPRLRDGFLQWWNERRRWTNAPFTEIPVPTSQLKISGQDVTVKVDCVLAVKDGVREDHYVYPYWFETPVISDESARVALWFLTQALPQIDPGEIRLLDVMRGQNFAIERNPFQGNEAGIFSRRLERLVSARERLRSEYDF